MFRKKLLVLALTAIMLISAFLLPVNAATLTVNGEELDCYVEKGITFTSVRSFAELFDGLSVSWDSRNKIAGIEGNGLDMDIHLNKYYSVANGRALMRDSQNENVKGRAYAPVTVLAEAFGLEVSWDKKQSHVSVSGSFNALESGTGYYNSEDLYWLSRIIHAESAGESFMGKCAVGNVVLNRVASSQYPSTIKGVIFDTKYGVQFTPTSNGAIYNEPSAESILAAKACLDGFSKSDKVLYFLNPRTAQSNWIVKNCKYVFTVGNHDFYA